MVGNLEIFHGMCVHASPNCGECKGTEVGL